MAQRNSRRKPVKGKLKTLLMSLNDVLRQHNRYNFDGTKIVSGKTRWSRAGFYEKTFRDLFELGYRLRHVKGFKEKHFIALLGKWIEDEVSYSTIVNRISMVKTFCTWINKQGLVRPMEYYFEDPSVLSRPAKTSVDKSLSGQGVDVAALVEKLRQLDPHVAIQFELQRMFGLRVRESWLLRPIAADRGEYLDIAWGTKGGRHRTHPISTTERRELLERAKQMVNKMSGSMVPQNYKLEQWGNHYYYILKRAGVCRKNGFTSHSNRHEAANEYYQELTGSPSPIKKNKSTESSSSIVDKELDEYARLEVAERLGHSRKQITGAYIG